jgi:hypothetical protein
VDPSTWGGSMGPPCNSLEKTGAGVCSHMLTEPSSTAAATPIQPRLHSSRTLLARVPLLQRRRVAALASSRRLPTDTWIKSSRPRLALSASTSFSSSVSQWFSSTGWSKSDTATLTRRTAWAVYSQRRSRVKERRSSGGRGRSKTGSD